MGKTKNQVLAGLKSCDTRVLSWTSFSKIQASLRHVFKILCAERLYSYLPMFICPKTITNLPNLLTIFRRFKVIYKKKQKRNKHLFKKKHQFNKCLLKKHLILINILWCRQRKSLLPFLFTGCKITCPG